MPGPVAVLTDSTASLPPEVASAHRITVVPLHVAVGGRETLDRAAEGAQVAAEMRSGTRVTTSQPSVAELVAGMTEALGPDGAELVCVHLSGELSGTVEVSRQAAEEVMAERPGCRVQVVDTRTVAGGTGLTALAAAQAAERGRSGDAVAAVAREVAAKSLVLFAVPDLQHLLRGGRLRSATSVVGTALGIRPVLGIADGRVTVVEAVRGTARARRRMVARAVRWAGGPGAQVPHPPGERVRLAVHHFDAAEAAESLQDQLTAEVADTGAVVTEVVCSEVTAVVGAHAGPGVLAVVVAPAP